MKKNSQLLKIVAIGDSGVGKTNIITRFCEGTYKESYVATIGVDFKLKTMDVDNQKVKLQLWDTAGQERFRTITHNYYRGAAGVMVVYAIDNKQSFLNIHSWLQQINNNTSEPPCKILIAAKFDLDATREVSIQEGQQIAREYGMKYIEVSAKEDINI